MAKKETKEQKRLRMIEVNQPALLSNVAACAAELHGNKELYDAFYDRYADRLGGFTGIFDLCIDMGKRISAYEASYEDHEAICLILPIRVIFELLRYERNFLLPHNLCRAFHRHGNTYQPD